MKTILCSFLLCLAVLAQNDRTVTPGRDARRVAVSGYTLPALCEVGELFQKHGDSAGLYSCTAANTWSAATGAVDASRLPDLSGTYQPTSGRNQPNGYVGLDANSNASIGTPLPNGDGATKVVNSEGGFYENGTKITSATPVNPAGLADVTCNGNVTTALAAAITALEAANGGTVRLSSGSCYSTAQLVRATSKSLRITGYGPTFNGIGGGVSGGTQLDLRYASGPKITTTQAGYFEIDHLALLDTTDGTQNFVYTTNGSVNIHDVSFWGKSSARSPDFAMPAQDGIVLGGTTAPTGYQGYGTYINNNWFSNIRRAVYVRLYGNSVNITNNTVWNTCAGDAAFESDGTGATNGGINLSGNLIEAPWYKYGVKLIATVNSSFTANSFWDPHVGQPIAAATNAGAAVLTRTAHALQSGQSITITGATGNWTPINGTFTVTRLSADTFSIPVDSSGFGALSGSPIYAVTAAYYTADSTSVNNLFTSAFGLDLGALVVGVGATSSTIIDARSGKSSAFPSLSAPAFTIGSTTANDSVLRVTSTGSPTNAPRTSYLQSGASEFVVGQNATDLLFSSNPSGYTAANLQAADKLLLTLSPAGNVIKSAATTAKPLVVRGVSSQSANLFEVQNAGQSALLSVDTAGAVMGYGGFKVQSAVGISATKTVKGSDGNNCTVTITGGIITATTCP